MGSARNAMKRGAAMVFLGSLTMAATLAVATPASAETVGPFPCNSNSAGVVGSTEHNGQITYVAGLASTHCGTLGIRVYYSHVGGASWTPWKYSQYGGGYVSRNVGTPIKSQHTASQGNLNFTSRNG